MKTLKLFMAVALIAAFSFTSCEKEEASGVSEGKMTSSVDGVSLDFTTFAMKYSSTQGTTPFEYIMISGTGGVNGTDISNMKSFAITVYAEKIEAKTYTVPTYIKGYTYSPITGYAMGVYIKTATQDSYVSINGEKAAGSVTISSISATSVKGSYNMTLVNSKDMTKTMVIKGDFNAKFTDIPGMQ